MSALSRLTSRISGWRQQYAACRELDEIGPEGREALSRDVGTSPDRLVRLAARGAASTSALYRLLRALGLDLQSAAKADRALARDMELVCAECRSSSRCARDLDAGKAHLEYESYCPNATTLAALLQDRPDAAPQRTAAGRPQWGFSKELDRAARVWPMAKRVERQARLMGAMMARVGVDPSAAAREGRGVAFAAASRRCLACVSFDACERWLEEGGGDRPPAFCPNASFLDRTRTRGAASATPDQSGRASPPGSARD